MSNVFTVDVEDWAHGLLGGATPITSRVRRNVRRMLRLLDKHHVRGTFFVLGKVCEQFPQLLPEIAAAGHEIGSHGYSHRRVDRMTRDEFRSDVQRSGDLIVQQTGRSPVGFRAPQFSVTWETQWAGPILKDLGFKYSSSVFPFNGPRYGIADAPRYPYRWNNCDLIEFPLATLEWCGCRLPVAGGGYLRLLPVCLLAEALRQANALGQPAAVYMHPYELDVREVRQLRKAGMPVNWSVAFKQSLFRSLIPRRLTALFARFSFAPMREVLQV